jgi:hypothetical protein
VDGERSRLRGSESPLFAASIASYQHIGSDLTDSQSFMLIHAPCCPVNQEHMPFAVVRQIAFLRFRPLQRNVPINHRALAEVASFGKVVSNRTGNAAKSPRRVHRDTAAPRCLPQDLVRRWKLGLSYAREIWTMSKSDTRP